MRARSKALQGLLRPLLETGAKAFRVSVEELAPMAGFQRHAAEGAGLLDPLAAEIDKHEFEYVIPVPQLSIGGIGLESGLPWT